MRRIVSPDEIGPILALVAEGWGARAVLKVLFVTTEMDDFVRVGGLAAVSAALPRALRPWSDVRIMLPGYRDVLEQLTHIEIVGQCASLGEMPACSLGRAATRDGLPIYVLLCPQLYDRPGNPYGDEQGRDWPDNDVRFGRFASAASSENKKDNKKMINVVNEYQEDVDVQNVYDLDNGQTFLGTVEDIDGEPRTGVFLKAGSTLVLLDDAELEFGSADDSYETLKVSNYKTADITVTVTDAY